MGTKLGKFIPIAFSLQQEEDDENCVIYSKNFIQALIALLSQPEEAERIVELARDVCHQSSNASESEAALVKIFLQDIKTFLPCYFDPQTGSQKESAAIKQFHLNERWDLGSHYVESNHPLAQQDKKDLVEFMDANIMFEAILEELSALVIDFSAVPTEHIEVYTDELFVRLDAINVITRLEDYQDSSNVLIQKKLKVLHDELDKQRQHILSASCAESILREFVSDVVFPEMQSLKTTIETLNSGVKQKQARVVYDAMHELITNQSIKKNDLIPYILTVNASLCAADSASQQEMRLFFNDMLRKARKEVLIWQSLGSCLMVLGVILGVLSMPVAAVSMFAGGVGCLRHKIPNQELLLSLHYPINN